MAEEERSELFALTLTGNGIQISREIGQHQLTAIMNVLMGGSASFDRTTAASPGTPTEPPAKISLREYLDMVKASRKPDQIVAMGHYIGVYESQPTFSRGDIKARFAAAKEPMPSNFSRDFGTAIKAGAIAEDHQKDGNYYVTKTGIQLVDRHFGVETNK